MSILCSVVGMTRTTVDIDASVLREAKRLSKERGKSLGDVVSELLASALDEQVARTPSREFEWASQDMGARIDIDDKDALMAALDDE